MNQTPNIKDLSYICLGPKTGTLTCSGGHFSLEHVQLKSYSGSYCLDHIRIIATVWLYELARAESMTQTAHSLHFCEHILGTYTPPNRDKLYTLPKGCIFPFAHSVLPQLIHISKHLFQHCTINTMDGGWQIQIAFADTTIARSFGEPNPCKTSFLWSYLDTFDLSNTDPTRLTYNVLHEHMVVPCEMFSGTTTSIVFSHDSSLLLAADDDGHVAAFETHHFTPVWTTKLDTDSIQLDPLPDGKSLRAFSFWEKEFYLDLRTGALLRSNITSGIWMHSSPKKRWVLEDDGLAVRVSDPIFAHMKRPERTEGMEDEIKHIVSDTLHCIVPPAFSPYATTDGIHYILHTPRELTLWSFAEQRTLQTLKPREGNAIALSPNMAWCAIHNENDKTVTLIHIATDSDVYTHALGEKFDLVDMAWSHDGAHFTIAGIGDEGHAYTYPCNGQKPSFDQPSINPLREDIDDETLLIQESAHFAISSGLYRTRLRNRDTHALILDLKNDYLYACAIICEEQGYVLLWGECTELHAYDVSTGARRPDIERLHTHTYPRFLYYLYDDDSYIPMIRASCNHFAWGAHEEFLYTAARGGFVEVWNLSTKKHTRSLSSIYQNISSLSCSPDGLYMVIETCNELQLIRLSDNTCIDMYKLSPHGTIKAPMWSPDGTWAVLSHDDAHGRGGFLTVHGTHMDRNLTETKAISCLP